MGSRREPAATLPPVNRDPSGRLPLVLAVDDEEHITELVAMALGYNGFEVERAASGGPRSTRSSGAAPTSSSST